MNGDYKELVEYLDKKFEDIDATFGKLPGIFPTKDEVVTKQDFESLRESFDKLATAVDKYAKKADAFFDELVMLSHKVDRHEKWLLQIAEKLGIKLEY